MPARPLRSAFWPLALAAALSAACDLPAQTEPTAGPGKADISEAEARATLYLSARDFSGAENGWGPAERDRSNGESGGADGRPIAIGGVSYDRGLGVHAESRLRFELQGDCERFAAEIGVDDEVEGGSVVFRVFGDDALLYESAVLTGFDAPVPVALDIAIVDELVLEVTDAGDGGFGDHADWADARVVCSPPAAETQARRTGTGLTASYYDDASLETLRFTRVDPRPGFAWTSPFADDPMGAAGISARWEGEIWARYGDAYSFEVESASAYRLWVDGALVSDSDGTKATAALVAGERYSVEFEVIGAAEPPRLYWASARQVRQEVPQSRLFARAGQTPPWRGLALIISDTDVEYADPDSGEPRRFRSSLTEDEVRGARAALHDGARRVVEWSSGRGNMLLDVVVVDETVTTLSPYGDGFWVAPQDVEQVLDAHAPAGSYDSIFLVWDPDGEEGRVPSCCYLGLAPTDGANGATYASLPSFNEREWGAEGYLPGEVVVHEWLHGTGHHYRDGLGLDVPDPHDAGEFGYTKDDDGTARSWYEALLSGGLARAEGAPAGYTRAVWERGTIIEPRPE